MVSLYIASVIDFLTFTKSINSSSVCRFSSFASASSSVRNSYTRAHTSSFFEKSSGRSACATSAASSTVGEHTQRPAPGARKPTPLELSASHDLQALRIPQHSPRSSARPSFFLPRPAIPAASSLLYGPKRSPEEGSPACLLCRGGAGGAPRLRQPPLAM